MEPFPGTEILAKQDSDVLLYAGSEQSSLSREQLRVSGSVSGGVG